MATREQIARAASAKRKPLTVEQIQATVVQRFKRPIRPTRTVSLVRAHIDALESGKPTVSPLKRRLRAIPSGTAKPFRRIG